MLDRLMATRRMAIVENRMPLWEFQEILFSSRRPRMMSHALASTQMAVWGHYSTVRIPLALLPQLTLLRLAKERACAVQG